MSWTGGNNGRQKCIRNVGQLFVAYVLEHNKKQLSDIGKCRRIKSRYQIKYQLKNHGHVEEHTLAEASVHFLI